MDKLLKFGAYPAAYDSVKHGPYDPARYYGKRKSAYRTRSHTHTDF